MRGVGPAGGRLGGGHAVEREDDGAGVEAGPEVNLDGMGHPGVEGAGEVDGELAHLGPGLGVLVGVGLVVVPDDGVELEGAGDDVDDVGVLQVVPVGHVPFPNIDGSGIGEGDGVGDGAGEHLHAGVPDLVNVQQAVDADGVVEGGRQFVPAGGGGVEGDDAGAAVAVNGVVDDVGDGEDVVVGGGGVVVRAEVDDVVDAVAQTGVLVVQDAVAADERGRADVVDTGGLVAADEVAGDDVVEAGGEGGHGVADGEVGTVVDEGSAFERK